MTQTYISTPADVRRLTSDILTASERVTEGRGTYLKMLIATTVDELGATPARSPTRGRQPKLQPEERQRQLAALETVNGRFYPAVVAAAEATVPRGRGAAKELNRRTNFARSTLSTVRAWLRAGGDITRVHVPTITKASLRVEGAPRPLTGARLRRRVESCSRALVAAVLELVETDKVAAREEIELLMGQLAHELTTIGGATVRTRRHGAEEGAPFKEGGRIYVPVTETQVLRPPH